MIACAMTDSVQDKKALRAEMRRRLSALTDAERHALSVRTCERVARSESFGAALTVMLYLPVPDELDVAPLALKCFQLGKTVCAPKIDWDRKRMTPVEVRSFDESFFEVQRHGVREPVGGRCVAFEEIDLVIVPGLAFDTAGARLGRGGGFYDRFLSNPGFKARVVRVGVAFDFQIVDVIPTEATDARVHEVATDRRLIRAEAARPAPGA